MILTSALRILLRMTSYCHSERRETERGNQLLFTAHPFCVALRIFRRVCRLPAANCRRCPTMSGLSEIGRRGTLRISIIKKAEGCSSRLTFPILVIVLDNLSLWKIHVMKYCNTCKTKKGFPTMGTFVGSHNAKYAGVYSRWETPAYGYAVPEFLAFVELPNLLIFYPFVAVNLFLKQINEWNHYFNMHDSAWLHKIFYICHIQISKCTNYATFAIE